VKLLGVLEIAWFCGVDEVKFSGVRVGGFLLGFGVAALAAIPSGFALELNSDQFKLVLFVALVAGVVAFVLTDYLSAPKKKIEGSLGANVEDLISEIAIIKGKVFESQDGDPLSITHQGRSLIEESGSGVEADPVIAQFGELINRLEVEVATLERRSNVNVIIGVVSAVIIVMVAGYVLAFKVEGDVYSYLPLLSIVLVVELFSFFFLRLYKKNLDDIKFFRNEISNFESKRIAYLMSRDHLTDKIPSVVEAMLGVERNFVLKKDESTIDVERAKVDVSMLDKIIAAIGKVK